MIYKVEENDIMLAFDKVITYLNELFEEKLLVAFNNTKECIKVYEGENIPLKVTVGQEVLKGSAAYECMMSKRTINKIIPKEVFGVPYKVYAFPIYDDNKEIVGSISICKSLIRQNGILSIAENIERSLSEISGIVAGIAINVQNAALESENINEKSIIVKKEVAGTDKILSMVKEITNQNNLLSLNARIEAARVGELGKGFAVVAREMGNLAKSSKDSLKEIEDKLLSVREAFNDITEKYSNMNSGFGEQVSSLEEIAANIEDLNKTSTNLRVMAEKM